MKPFGHLWPAFRLLLLLLAGSGLVASSGRGALLPFPVSSNQRATVTCLENSSYTYDIYLPPAYVRTGNGLPIFYTMYSSGGGMVSYFQSVCSNQNIIVVGLTRARNGSTWDEVFREIHVVTRDIRQRVLYDPTAEFAGGFSGGGDCAYMFSRFRSQHVAGLFEMGDSMGRINFDGPNVRFYSNDRVQTNLWVMRATGNADTNALFYLPFHSNFLATCGANIGDWSFNGGHQVPPDSTKSNCLAWLVSHRVPAGPQDRSIAFALSTNWAGNIAQGRYESVLRECVSNLIQFPRSWKAYYAQLTLDDLLTNAAVFRMLNVSNLADGYFAADLFYYYARSAATNGDWPRYYSCMKALTGITDTNWVDGTITNSGIVETYVFPTDDGKVYIVGSQSDRAGLIYNLLTNANHFLSPIIYCSTDPVPGQMRLWLTKDMPCLAYTVQSKANLGDSLWLEVVNQTVDVDTNTFWSTSLAAPADPGRGFYRVSAVPIPASAPPLPY